MTEHTPGNWSHHWNGHYFTIDIGPGDYDPAVAHVHLNHVLNMSKEDAEANARLVSAAPDLLAALKLAKEHSELEDEVLDIVDAAISKATS